MFDPKEYELSIEEKHEVYQTAESFVNSSDETLKLHAEFCVAFGREYFKYAKTYTEGHYQGSTLWIDSNTTFTVTPSDVTKWQMQH